MPLVLLFLVALHLGATDSHPPDPTAGSRTSAAWVWSGALTSVSALVKAKILEPASEIRLLVSTDAKFSTSRSVPDAGFVKPDDNGMVVFDIRNLQPDTLYHYAVEAEGQRSLTGRFRTFADGPMSFKVAFASCATTGSRNRIFSTIRNLDPLFFLHMGDFHYENIEVNDPGAYRKAYDRVLTSDLQSALYRHVPIAYIWDDHDFGPNDSDRTAPGKPAALQTYQECVPHYPLSDYQGTVETIHQSFPVGRVRFLLTDGRSERSPANEPDGPGKTMLGLRQRDWLFDQLSASRDRYALIVWVNVVPWITKSARGSDHGWEPYSHERALIADYIKAQGLVDRLLVLSGDAHMVAIDDGSNSNYAGDQEPGEPAFPVVQAAPLDRYPHVKGGPFSHGVYARKILFGLVKIQQFGLMKVTDDGNVLEVELSGHDADGNVLAGMLLKLRCDVRGCRIAH